MPFERTCHLIPCAFEAPESEATVRPLNIASRTFLYICTPFQQFVLEHNDP